MIYSTLINKRVHYSKGKKNVTGKLSFLREHKNMIAI